MEICYLCHKRRATERHHIFGGAMRKKSEKYGLTVDLCHWCHNEPPDGVHYNATVREQLQAEGQRKAMAENGWTNKHLAELCHMKPDAASRAIKHPLTTKFNTLAIIADKLGIGSIPIK